MKEKRIGSLLIKGYEGYVGIVSEKDLLYKVVGEDILRYLLPPNTVRLSSIMTESILSIEKMWESFPSIETPFRSQHFNVGIQNQSSGNNRKRRYCRDFIGQRFGSY